MIVVWNAINKLVTSGFSVRVAAVKLRHEASKCSNIKDCVDLSGNIFNNFPFQQLSIRCLQIKREMVELLKVLASHNPKYVLEIGTSAGGTLFLFTRVSDPEALIISIDLPGSEFGRGYPEWRIPMYKSFAMPKQKIYLVREDSHALSALNIAEKILEGHKLDFLFIDGDHSYDGVKADFEAYSKLVGNGGLIAFHDIVPGPPEKVGGVRKFWNEIKRNFEYMELVENWKQGGYGIGVIRI